MDNERDKDLIKRLKTDKWPLYVEAFMTATPTGHAVVYKNGEGRVEMLFTFKEIIEALEGDHDRDE